MSPTWQFGKLDKHLSVVVLIIVIKSFDDRLQNGRGKFTKYFNIENIIPKIVYVKPILTIL